jgi:thioredoxin reductase
VSEIFDCIVIGGGPAGLSAALFLARYRRRVLALHHNSPRNLYSHGVHGFLGHHGILPTDLLARGRDEVTRHGGLLIQGCVSKLEKLQEDRFRVSTGGGTVIDYAFEARRVVLATGLRDFTPDCPGFHELYGHSVHHCPDCDGFEHTGQRVAVLGKGDKAIPFAMGLLTWTDKLTLITNGSSGELSAEGHERLARAGIEVVHKEVASLEGDFSQRQLHRVRFTDGDALECDALFFSLGNAPANDLHDQVGCNVDEGTGLISVDARQETSVSGLFAAGDITANSQLAVVAAAEGAIAAIQIHRSLLAPDRR